MRFLNGFFDLLTPKQQRESLGCGFWIITIIAGALLFQLGKAIWNGG